MKPDYRNWALKNMLYLLLSLLFFFYAITILHQWFLEPGTTRTVWSILCLIVAVSLTVICL